MLLLPIVCLFSTAAALRPYPVPAEHLEMEEEGRGFFAFHTPEQRRMYLGARLDEGHASKDHLTITQRQTKEKLPKIFVAGWDDWVECQNTIAYIKDQAACGSCWAVAASEVVAHRTCISCDKGKCSDHAKYPELLNERRPCLDMSAEQILACCSWCGDGCQGGYPIDAMQYWAKTGVVSGGWYGSKCGCQPYQIPPMSSSAAGPEGSNTPACQQSCESGYPVPFAQDKHYASDARKVVGEEAMMEEIYHHGSIECAFSVSLLRNPASDALKVVGEEAMMEEIYHHGSIECAFSVSLLRNPASDARKVVGEEAMMEEIYHHGSIECAFSVSLLRNPASDARKVVGEEAMMEEIYHHGSIECAFSVSLLRNPASDARKVVGEEAMMEEIYHHGSIECAFSVSLLRNPASDARKVVGEEAMMDEIYHHGSIECAFSVSLLRNPASDARKVVGEEAMMEEIYHHGSIECAFSVYSNFMNYKNGIYDHKAGYFDGGHAVTIIGWGETKAGRKYWVINNSWNVTWGANGMFFWAKGVNLLGMEGGCVAGTPKCNNKNDLLTCL